MANTVPMKLWKVHYSYQIYSNNWREEGWSTEVRTALAWAATQEEAEEQVKQEWGRFGKRYRNWGVLNTDGGDSPMAVMQLS